MSTTVSAKTNAKTNQTCDPNYMDIRPASIRF